MSITGRQSVADAQAAHPHTEPPRTAEMRANPHESKRALGWTLSPPVFCGREYPPFSLPQGISQGSLYGRATDGCYGLGMSMFALLVGFRALSSFERFIWLFSPRANVKIAVSLQYPRYAC